MGAVSSRAPSPGSVDTRSACAAAGPAMTTPASSQPASSSSRTARRRGRHAATRWRPRRSARPDAGLRRRRRPARPPSPPGPRPPSSSRWASARSACTCPAPRSARVTGTSSAAKESRKGSAPAASRGRRRHGEERRGHGEVPGAGLVGHVRRRAHRGGAGDQHRPGDAGLRDADGEQRQPQRRRPAAALRAAAATPGSSRGSAARTAAVRSGTCGRRRQPRPAGDQGGLVGPAGAGGHAARWRPARAAGIPRGSPSSRAEIASRNGGAGSPWLH